MLHEMAPADAAMYWASMQTGNDQFLLFAFERSGEVSDAELTAELRRRAAGIADLHLAVEPVPVDLDYPRWTTTGIRDDAIVVHPRGRDWADCRSAVAALIGTQLREDRSLWRIHVFDDVQGVPRASSAAGRVVVLQISHALGDGRRVSAIARALFGGEVPIVRDQPVAVEDHRLAALRGTALIGPRMAWTTVAGLAASARRDPPDEVSPSYPAATVPGPVPATRLNTDPGDHRVLRTLTVPADRVRPGGAPVTAGALAVLAEVLPGFVGAPDAGPVVELTVAFDDPHVGASPPDDSQPDQDPGPLPRNRFQTVGMSLHTEVPDRAERAQLIAADIRAARRRVNAPSRVAEREVAAAAPAVLASAAVRMRRDAPRPSHVSGATMVSSVDRGPADLVFAGCPVVFTAGFPALSRVHGMTHGVHGIGGAVTISVCAGGPAAVGIDGYLEQLARAFG
ncbi:WS/DGAT domain-containing protein [Gordonia zhaorongruii]|uniref:WS/DGAT domain-containing protein n=1 Tax=Gordonia zhaorongruii TaxID=2597659 RepID=UPI001F285056|nr:WS/DGAT domain-containing protein [Gordonia zhaorongruii]